MSFFSGVNNPGIDIGSQLTISEVLTVQAINALGDAGADKILGWDDTDNTYKFFTLGSGLTYDHATHTLTASGSSGATTALDNLAAVAINAALVLATNDAFALGSAAKSWSDLFLASGAVINFNNGDVTVTHAANNLLFAGASSGYTFDAKVYPTTDDGAALGDTTHNFSDLFLATGAVLNFANSNVAITHSSGILTMGTGEMRITTVGTNTASVVTVGGTQTLTAKTLTSPTITTSPTAVGATWTDLGTVTTIDINGGTLDGAVVGGASAANGTFTTLQVNTNANPDADDGAALGTGVLGWSDLFLASGAVINFNNGNVTLTHSAGVLTLGGTSTLALGSNSLTLTGSIAATGARATKVWTAALESTAMPTVGGTAILTSLTAPQFTTIELGAATDTTLARVSAGVISVEGVTIDTISATNTLTNKRITPRVVTAADATSVTPNSDSADVTYQLNTQAGGTLTINADGGTATNGQLWIFKVKSTNVQTYAWNAVFVGGGVTLPTTTSGSSKIDYIGFIFDTVNSKWHCISTAANY